MKTITVRNVPPDIATALAAERRRRGLSLNRTVLALMREALGLANPRRRSNGLRRLAGTWTEADFRQFEEAVASFQAIDEDMWKCFDCVTKARVAFDEHFQEITRVGVLIL